MQFHHTLDAGLGYHQSGVGVDLRAHRVGTREVNFYAPDFSVSHVTLAPYTRVDVSGELAVFAESHSVVTLTLRVENLLGANYTDVAGANYDFARTDDASLARTGYRGAPRRALTGLKVSF